MSSPARRRFPAVPVALGLSAVVLLGGALALGMGGAADRIAPGIRVGGTDLGGLSRQDAVARLGAQSRPTPQVTVQAGQGRWDVPASRLGWAEDTEAEVDAAIRAGRERNLLQRAQALLGRPQPQDLAVVQHVDAAQARAALDTLVADQNTAARNARLTFDGTRYIVRPGVPGVQVQVEAGVQRWAAHPELRLLVLARAEAQPQHSTQAIQALADQGNALLRPLKVQLGPAGPASTLSAAQVANLFWVRSTGLELDTDALASEVKLVAEAVDEPAQNARYAAKGAGLVKVPEQAGQVSDPAEISRLLGAAVLDPKIVSIVLTPTISTPTLTLAQLPDAAKLSLIATGKSTYAHSSPARRVNVANAAARINGAVVAGGEDFSFLNTLGSISPENGFVTGLIISAGRTVDGLGGGVCQVSTTTFRALYQAGLPVVERNQHAYRVGYYEPQVGYEAAVYDPGKDLKFRNDTGGPVLIKTVNDNARSTLTVQVWGLPQSRKVQVSPAVITAHTAHPAAKYLPSSELPKGAVKQIDWAADGYELYITRTITDKGHVSTDRTTTSYKPWQAIYEVGQ